MDQLSNVIGEQGIKFEVGLNLKDILIMVALLFVAMIIAGMIVVFTYKNISK